MAEPSKIGKCPNCGGALRDYIPPPRHGVHMRQAACGHWREFNCVGKPIGDCEACLEEDGHG